MNDIFINLCRGKRKANNKWVYGDLIHHHSIIGQPLNSYIKPFYDDTEYLVDNKTVGRYIGRIDENDIKIFEGDILQATWYDYTEPRNKVCGEVVYNKNLAAWVIYDNDSKTMHLLENDAYCLILKVIGNIYDAHIKSKE